MGFGNLLRSALGSHSGRRGFGRSRFGGFGRSRYGYGRNPGMRGRMGGGGILSLAAAGFGLYRWYRGRHPRAGVPAVNPTR